MNPSRPTSNSLPPSLSFSSLMKRRMFERRCTIPSRTSMMESKSGCSLSSTSSVNSGKSINNNSPRQASLRPLHLTLNVHSHANANFARLGLSRSNSSDMPKSHRRRRSSIGYEKIVQRSSSKTVKTALAMIQALCAEQSSSSEIQAPTDEVEMLAELAVDSYYRIIIKKYKGQETMIQAMALFPQLETPCLEVLKQLQPTEQESMGIIEKRSPSPTSFSSLASSSSTAVPILPSSSTNSRDGEEDSIISLIEQ